MYLRMTFVDGDPNRIDDLITYVRTVVKPATDELPGNHGLGMWVNRHTGECLVMTVWNDAESLRASEAAVTALRDDGAGIVDGDSTVERYESVMVDATAPNQIGNLMRLVRSHGVRSEVDGNIAWAQSEVLPRVRGIGGYLSFALGVDRETGAAVSSETFRDADAIAAHTELMAAMGPAATNRHITIDSVTDYEVAIVGIRAETATPMDMPTQRTVDLTEQRART